MKSGEIKLFVGILFVALILVGFAVYPTMVSGVKPPPVVHTQPDLNREILIPPGSHIRGNHNAPFCLIEFGDYECPTCKTRKTDVDVLLEKFRDKLQLVYHHTQISPTHKNSTTLALAAYAAEQQGKFWQMHDKLYDAQDTFHDQPLLKVVDLLTGMAANLKIDVLRFRSDMKTDAARKAIAADNDLGSNKARIPGTPAFFFLGPSGPPKFIPQDMLKRWLSNEANWK